MNRLTCFPLVFALFGCGAPVVRIQSRPSDGALKPDEMEQAALRKAPREQVLDSLVLSLSERELSLAPLLEEQSKISGSVKAQKYLRLSGSLVAENGESGSVADAGCLAIELRDNVFFREKTFLRLATSGITGETYEEVRVPLLAEMGGWREVPRPTEALELAAFPGTSVKKFDGSLCFRLDYSNAPAQKYKGQVIVQYLRETDVEAPPACRGATLGECAPGTGTEEPPVSHRPPSFRCLSEPVVLRAGQFREFEWSNPWETQLSFALREQGGRSADLGTLSPLGGNKVRYTAPASVKSEMKVLLAASLGEGFEVVPQFCEATLVPDDDIGVADDLESDGLVGNVYKLPSGTPRLPDFSLLTPVARVMTGNLDIAPRPFEKGFPGVKDLVEWFGVSFAGNLVVPATGEWDFEVNSDDGAILSIDGAKVVDNDGVHAPAAKRSRIPLTQGMHAVRIDYYQGPRYQIALQLKWKRAGETQFRAIPPEAFTRALGPTR